MKHSISKRAGTGSQKTLDALIQPAKGQPRAHSNEARNKANTIRNSVKAENYLMEVEKAHGFAKSWALRERLEQGHVSFDELMRR